MGLARSQSARPHYDAVEWDCGRKRLAPLLEVPSHVYGSSLHHHRRPRTPLWPRVAQRTFSTQRHCSRVRLLRQVLWQIEGRPLCPAYLSSRLLPIHISGSESGIASLHRRFRLNEKCDLKCPHCALTPPYGDFLFNRFVSVDCRENRQRQGAGVGRTLWALCSGLSPEIGAPSEKNWHAS